MPRHKIATCGMSDPHSPKPAFSGPLAGVRIIDLTGMVMGPYATQIMADMGADVIKVEPPGGDTTRFISVAPEPGMSGIFVNCNRGKRSIMLDLTKDDDRAVLTALIKTAEVFIHSMRGKAIAKLGFDYEAVKAIKPDIVYTNCYGYGRRGPDADKPAYDDTIQAECGLTMAQQALTGRADFVGSIIADKISGLTAVYATTMALFHKARSGQGQEVEVAMFEAMASFMLVEHMNGALFTPPLGDACYPRAVAPNRRPYETADGQVAALIYNDKQWKLFVDAVKPDWATDDMQTLVGRARQIDKVYSLLAETFRQRTSADWLALLTGLGIPCAPLRSTADLASNAHLEAVGFWETVESDLGPIRFPGVPTWFGATPGRVHGPTPRLDEHGAAIRAELAMG